jgi:heat shock protein HslJ
MKNRMIFAIALMIFSLFASCKDPVGLDSNLKITQELNFSTIYKGNHNFIIDKESNFVIRNKEEEIEFLSKIQTNVIGLSGEKYSLNLGDIDYSKDMIICMARGMKPSGSISLEITSIKNQNGKLIVESKEYHPEIGDMSIGYPLHIIKTAKSENAVEFKETIIIGENENRTNLEFVTIFKKSHGIVSENKIFKVIGSKQDESEFLSMVHSNMFDSLGREIPVSIGEINYEKEMVIVAHYGMSTSGSHFIEIPNLELVENEIIVNTNLYIPDIGTDDIGYPVHIIKLNKQTYPVKFSDTKEIRISSLQNEKLSNSEWKWTAYQEGETQAPIPVNYTNDKHYHLNFGNTGNGSGTTNCNKYYFEFTADENNIGISNMAITEIYCNDDKEIKYVQALSKSYAYKYQDNILLIYTSDEKYSVMIFTRN